MRSSKSSLAASRSSKVLRSKTSLKMGLFDGLLGKKKDDDEPYWMQRDFKPVSRSDGQWEEFVDDESGYKYYYNTATAETLWEWEYQKEYMPEAVVEPQPVAAVQQQKEPVGQTGTLDRRGGGGFGGISLVPKWMQNAADAASQQAQQVARRGSSTIDRGSVLDVSKLSVVWRAGGGSTMFAGGFGFVFAGTYDTRTNPDAVRKDIKVVVKLPTTDPDAVTAFQREGEINKMIASYGGLPGVADFLGTVDLSPIQGRLPPGVGSNQGLVWSKVEGKTLNTFFDRGGGMSPVLATTLSVSNSEPVKLRDGSLVYIKRELCRQVLGEALLPVAALHSKGIIHRDLKPQNIMVVERDRNAPFRIIDFGSAVTKGQQPFMDDLSEIYAPPEAPTPDRSNPEGYDIYTVGIIGLRVLLPSLVAGEAGIATLGNVCTIEIPKDDYDLTKWATGRATNKVWTTDQRPLNQECKALLANEDLLQLLTRMIAKNPAQRPSAEECLAMLGPEWTARLNQQKQGSQPRGTCGTCGEPVFDNDLGRVKDAAGTYYHGPCAPRY